MSDQYYELDSFLIMAWMNISLGARRALKDLERRVMVGFMGIKGRGESGVKVIIV
jgi:hypothetical protein